jgi:acyl-CoA synthetase (AMP-forming)/AMP-acid ligase II/acyl carrier protein
MDSPRSLHTLIFENSNIDPKAPAILAVGGDVISYRQLAERVVEIALQLNRWGIGRDDRVAVVLPNGPEMAVTFLAASAVATCAPLNPSYTKDELKFSLQDLRAKALIALPGGDQPAYRAASEAGIPVIGLEAGTGGLFRLVSKLPIRDALTAPVLAELEDVALVLHTSGTTARPKIVPLTHRNIFHSARNISEAYSLAAADRCLNMMPLFHIHGLMGALAASLACGGSIICAPGMVPDRVLAWLSELKPTWYTAVPTMHQALLDEVRRQPEKASEVRLRFIRSCSSSLPPKVARDLESTFGVPVVEAYGMTEATHQIASNPLPPAGRKFGSVGLPTGTTKVAILGEQGKPLPANMTGEIGIRGENVMAGYENNPEANAASFTDGWLRTGDRGSVDEDGYIFIQGRLKELINRGGEKISPREIDEALLRHPAVRQAVAFAMPHPTLGEDVAAAVVLHAGQIVSMQELRRFAAAGLADFKVPRLIIFIPEIPKGATGKIQRIGLAEKLKPQLEAAKAQSLPGNDGPRDLVEEEILNIWQQVLDFRPIGVQDDFLALGGDSLMAARILMLVDEHFKVDLSLADLFNAPTVAAMAELVKERVKSAQL